MTSEIAPRPLMTWEGFRLRADLDMLELWLNRLLGDSGGAIRKLRMGGGGDELEIRARVVWEGLPSWVALRLSELRLYRGQLGCRVTAISGPLGIPVPVSLVAALLRRFAARYVRLDSDDRILIADLRQWLPPWLDLHVQDSRCRARWLELDLAPGALASWVTRPPTLPEE